MLLLTVSGRVRCLIFALPMLIVHHLTKRFGDYWALRGVDVDYAARGSGLFARPGEHYGVIPSSPRYARDDR